MEKNSNKSLYKDIFGQKPQTQQFQNKNTSVSSQQNFKKNINIKNIFIILFIILLLCFIIYTIICAVHYSKITCYEKKTFLKYMFDFSNNEVCILENKPIPITPKPLPPENIKLNLLPTLEKKKRSLSFIKSRLYI